MVSQMLGAIEFLQHMNILCQSVLKNTDRNVIVDPAGLDFLARGSTSGAGGASGAIYTKLRLRSFPPEVTKAIEKIGDAAWWSYTQGHRRAVVIHVAGPDCCGKNLTPKQAVATLSVACYSVFLCMLKQLRHPQGKQTELRLLPISSGIFAGKFKTKAVEQLTWQAVSGAFCRLQIMDKLNVQKLSITMCVLGTTQCKTSKKQ